MAPTIDALTTLAFEFVTVYGVSPPEIEKLALCPIAKVVSAGALTEKLLGLVDPDVVPGLPPPPAAGNHPKRHHHNHQ
jgi:hypothetical protein